MKIPIFHFKDKCGSCKKEIDIYYPERFAYKQGLGHIRETNTTTKGGNTFRNICPYCDSYQGNRIVWRRLLKKYKNLNVREYCVWVDEDGRSQLDAADA